MHILSNKIQLYTIYPSIHPYVVFKISIHTGYNILCKCIHYDNVNEFSLLSKKNGIWVSSPKWVPLQTCIRKRRIKKWNEMKWNVKGNLIFKKAFSRKPVNSMLIEPICRNRHTSLAIFQVLSLYISFVDCCFECSVHVTCNSVYSFKKKLSLVQCILHIICKY